MTGGCRLCREIPRLIRESSPHSMPACVRHLGPFDESGWRSCPECGARYLVCYEGTYDDMNFYEEIELRRDVSGLAQPELLEHGEAYIRQDAAYALARAGRPELGWGHSDPLVRRSALSALEEPADLRFLLDDEDGPTRQLAARLSLRWVLEHRDSLLMLGLLQNRAADVRHMAIAYLRHSEGLDAGLLAPALEQWSAREELAGLEWLAVRGQEPALQVERLLEASRHADPEVRKAAVSALDPLQPLWTPAVLARLLELLKDDRHCRYGILLSLQKLGPEWDLRAFVPVLAAFLATENVSFFQNVARVLERRLQVGEGSSELVCTLIGGLTFKNQHQRRLVGDCYRALMVAGIELGPAQELLVRSISADKTEYCDDLLVPAVTTYLVRRRCWPELERLLRGGTSVAGHVALVLSKEKLDYRPLEGALNELLDHKDPWVSENCLKALVR